jgi:hypothetical protein
VDQYGGGFVVRFAENDDKRVGVGDGAFGEDWLGALGLLGA